MILGALLLVSGCVGSIGPSGDCGNERLDTGETCDPPETCPTSCDDENPCTDDVMTGSAKRCNAACSYSPIEACADGDGCCPAGCNHSSDNDCSTLCGNNEIDAGETCDPPESCPTSCDDQNPCTTDTMTGSAGNCNVECGHADIAVCTDGDECCPPACDHNSDSDCPPCGPLADRVTVTEIDVSPVSVVTWVGGSWSSDRPVILSPLQNGTSQVAWLGSDNLAHITPLTAADTRGGPDTSTAADEIRGFVAHDDGNAVMIVRGDEMALVRLDSSGGVTFDVTLVGNNNHTREGDEWISDWTHEGRLAFDGGKYAVYFGLTRNWGASEGEHQGDMLGFINTDGSGAGGGWDWGCSHSMDVRLSHNGTRFGPLCISDCYPGKGIYFNHNTRVSTEDGSCGGSTAAEFGGMVPNHNGGFLLTFASKTNRPSYDVVFIPLDGNGSPGTKVFLTDTPSVNELNVHLALYGPDLLVFWHEGSRHLMARMDRTGTLLEQPVEIQAEAGQPNDMINFSNGDVGWAYAWGDRTRLKIVRVRYCE